jgi:hypothetical protein
VSTKRLVEFKAHISRARDLIGLGQSLQSMTFGQVDGTELYRSALVQAVAALDAYVHGVILDKSVDIILGRTPSAGVSTKLGIGFAGIQDIVTAANPVVQEIAARRQIAQRLSLETFQRPDAIGAIFSVVGVPKLWATGFPSGAKLPTQTLSLVVQRRNRIVHQCDADPLSPGNITPLSDADAIDAVNAVEVAVFAIDSIL